MSYSLCNMFLMVYFSTSFAFSIIVYGCM
jgi:hypothetical protein